jgi:hypothetical protein
MRHTIRTNPICVTSHKAAKANAATVAVAGILIDLLSVRFDDVNNVFFHRKKSFIGSYPDLKLIT